MSAIGKSVRHPPVLPSGSSGFTLIEALVVVAVAALVAGLAFPRVEQSLGYWRFRSSLTAIETALQQVRAEALRRRQPMRFVVDSVLLQPSTSLAEGNAAIDFYGDGSSSGGRVVLTGASGRRATLLVSADTGLIGILR